MPACDHARELLVLTPAAKKPVMVWMHGGGFTNGSSMEAYAYDGRSLSEFGDVVVVSMNHRLNILGTLDLSAYGPQYANSRYTGTADLVMALPWVQDNIEATCSRGNTRSTAASRRSIAPNWRSASTRWACRKSRRQPAVIRPRWRSRTKVSQAWINFAKTGSPSQSGLEWKPYTKEDPQAMVFDTVSRSVSLRDDRLVSLLPGPGAPAVVAAAPARSQPAALD